jgi:hypothetical protein
VHPLARPPRRTRRQAGPGHEGFDPVGGRRVGPEFGEKPASRLGKSSSCRLLFASTSAADSHRPSQQSKPASSGSGFALRQRTPA